MRKLTADYIFPASSTPIDNGVVIVDKKGIIIDVLDNSDGLEDVEHYEGIICPGFVNAHCHIELSHIKGKLPEHRGLVDFLKPIIKTRIADEEVIKEAIKEAEEEMIGNGIVGIGDVCNDGISFMQKTKGNLKYYNFIEVLSIIPEKAREVFRNGQVIYEEAKHLNLPASIVPHAPYTASPELLRLISEFSVKENGLITFHVQESAHENVLFVNGTGDFIKIYGELGINLDFFNPTGKNSLESSMKYLSPANKTQLVHNTYSTQEDINWAHSFGNNIYWCFCPNANLYIEDKLPDYDLFIEAGARITIGTDSLASNWSLSVLDELKTISKHAPHISLEQLLCWATKNGAEFLGFDDELGTLEKGKCPGINLIENLDMNSLQLTENSSVQRLI